MKRLRATLILSQFLMIYGTLVHAQASVFTGRGKVVDDITASPIPGVRVVIVGTDGKEYETTTDNSGEYEKSGLPPGYYMFEIYKAGYSSPVGIPVRVIAGAEHFMLLKMRSLDSLDKLIKALSDEEEQIRSDAARALGNMGKSANTDLGL
ncbi:carboxypeptidase regulatory-like domain-containing protein [Candidatus Poribacteria bacterium]|nr:carboxypeptidase regulatory-like domain-containing protein [Candidatus Poribacteria bacterium]